ncbi:MAG: AarF/ABC1/UbiB kinase family protein [Gammaproteobacteria bacterium]|nr:AarF/ABC1/UbiB kinase family protein [Gammaproteobacteria bacterium]
MSSRQRSMTTSRIGRLSMMGRLAGDLAGGMVSEGARQLARGQRPSLGSALLTSRNVTRLGERLSEMRGAAMKVGQLLSMDSGEVLPKEFSALLARLREDAHQMPLGDVADVLNAAWGEGWDRRFTRFAFTPIAAASIGQVHAGELRDGRRVAVKIQYPGIRASIDSDVDNVATLLGLFKVLPPEIDIAPLLDEAKQQLHDEADYTQEAAALQTFAAHLEGDARYQVPHVVDELSGEDVLTMEFLDGAPIESVAELSRERIDDVAADLVHLAFREVFDWGLVQTDPNFANYLYHDANGCIQLLDFGATRRYPAERRDALRGMLDACVDGSDDDVLAAAANVGYIADDPDDYKRTIVALLRTATEPLRAAAYRFGGSDLAQRMSDIVVEMRLRSRYGRLPPTDILFLHRKLAGLYLLLARLRARVDVRALACAHTASAEERKPVARLARA